MSEKHLGDLYESDAAALYAPKSRFVLGCQMAAMTIDSYLAGILAMQIYYYYVHQPKDFLWTKLLVGYVAIMNTVVTVYYWVFTQYIMVDNFGEWLPLFEVRWLENLPLFNAMCICAVQAFFAHRAYLSSKRSPYVVLGGCALITAEFAAAIGFKILLGEQDNLLGASSCGPALITWLVSTVAADLVIAVAIIWGRSESKISVADRMVSRLFNLSFELQLWPLLLGLAGIIQWSVQSGSLLGALFQFLQCKVYSVGILVVLNGRVNPYASMDRSGNAEPHTLDRAPRAKPSITQISVHTGTQIQDDGDMIELERLESGPRDNSCEELADVEGNKSRFNSRTRLTGPER